MDLLTKDPVRVPVSVSRTPVVNIRDPFGRTPVGTDVSRRSRTNYGRGRLDSLLPYPDGDRDLTQTVRVPGVYDPLVPDEGRSYGVPNKSLPLVVYRGSNTRAQSVTFQRETPHPKRI